MSWRTEKNPWIDLTPSPILVPPFSAGMWVRIDDSDEGFFGDIFSISNDANNYWDLYYTDGDINWDTTGPSGNFSNGVSIPSNGWFYVVMRARNYASRFLDAIKPDLSTQHSSSASDTGTITDIVRTQIGTWINGSGSQLNGCVAYFWMASSDVQADAAAMPDSLLRKMAFGGPFTNAYLAPNLVDYKTFLNGWPASPQKETYIGRRGFMDWELSGFQSASQGTVQQFPGPNPPFVNPAFVLPYKDFQAGYA